MRSLKSRRWILRFRAYRPDFEIPSIVILALTLIHSLSFQGKVGVVGKYNSSVACEPACETGEIEARGPVFGPDTSTFACPNFMGSKARVSLPSRINLHTCEGNFPRSTPKFNTKGNKLPVRYEHSKTKAPKEVATLA